MIDVERYELDLSSVPERYLPPLILVYGVKLPICRGKHEHDFDLLEDEMDWRYVSLLRTRSKQKYPTAHADAEKLPLGINTKELPPKARIIRVTS